MGTRWTRRAFVHVTPFAAAALAGFASVVLPPKPDYSEVGEAVALFALMIALVLAFDSMRPPARWSVVPPLMYVLVVAILREAQGGAASGYAPLNVLPVFWIALYGARWQLATCLAAVAVSFATPLLWFSETHYPASEWRRAVLWTIVSSLVGVTTQRLVQTQRTARERARTEADRFGSVLRAATEYSIIGSDRNGTITLFNEGAEKMLGYRAAELVGRATPAVLHHPAEIAARAAELGVEPGFDVFVHAAREGVAETRRWTYVRSDGATIPVSLTVSAIAGPNADVVGYIGIARSVEAELRAERAREAFVATVSHELRTPLTAIAGWTEILLEEEDEGPLTPEQRTALESTDRNAQRLLRLVDDLLLVAQIDTADLELTLDEVDIVELVDRTVQSLESLAAAKSIDVTVRAEHAAIPLEADVSQLGYVLANLLSNALKYTPEGGAVSIDVSTDADSAVVRVDDNGIGIPEDERERLFTRFFRASNATSRGIQGTGLGLAITKAIVEAHGGTIGVATSASGGSSFVVRVPRAQR